MEEDELDPRIQVELEKLNTATDEINKLEIELDEANTTFRMLLGECTRRLKVHSSKNGSAIVSARPYYEALDVARSAQQECQQAAVSFQRANEVHEAAKETVALAEARFKSQPEWRFDSAWQEMLNHATLKVRDAETQRAETAAYHGCATARYKHAQDKVHQMEQRLRRNVAKSRPYFEEKQRCNDQLAAQKEVVESLQAHVAMVKNGYASSLRRLEGISEEIHRKRAAIMAACSGVREPGVGAELEYKGELDRCDEPRGLPSKTDSDPEAYRSIGQGEPGVKPQSYSSQHETNLAYSLQGASVSDPSSGKGEPGTKTSLEMPSQHGVLSSMPSSSNSGPGAVESSGRTRESSSDSCSKGEPSFKFLSCSLQDESRLSGLQRGEQEPVAQSVPDVVVGKRAIVPRGELSTRHVDSVSNATLYSLEGGPSVTNIHSDTDEQVLKADVGSLVDNGRGELTSCSENEEVVSEEKEVVIEAKLTLGGRPNQDVVETVPQFRAQDCSETVSQGNVADAADAITAVECGSSVSDNVIEKKSHDKGHISVSLEYIQDGVHTELNAAEELSLTTERCLELEAVEEKYDTDNKFYPETESSLGVTDEEHTVNMLISAATINVTEEQELDGNKGQNAICSASAQEKCCGETNRGESQTVTAARSAESDKSNKGANVTANIEVEREQQPNVTSPSVDVEAKTIRQEEESCVTKLAYNVVQDALQDKPCSAGYGQLDPDNHDDVKHG